MVGSLRRNREEGYAYPLSSSSSDGAEQSPAKHLTPDTGSEDEEEDVFFEDGKGDEEGYELREGTRGRHDGEGSRRSNEERPPPRRRRRRQLYTAEEEKAVVRKFDRRLVVFVALLYMLSFLDRSNIGNARVAGMDDDLQSIPPRDDWYEWALGAFYIAYIVFEWMSLLWRVIPAHIYVAALVLSWGVIASLQSVAVNYPMLIFLRTLLGIGEAGFTGVPFYLSFFFKRDELAFRTAIFISATSFASSLAWLILKLSSTLSVLLDPAAWLTSLIFLLTNTAYSSLPVFLPTILSAMGHTPLTSQALSAPPYLLSFLLVLATAYASDKLRARSPFIIIHALASAAGYAVLALADSRWLRLEAGSVVRYLAVYPAAVGFFNVVVLTIAWSINNQRGEKRQGAGFVLLQVVGQLGPLVGTRLYPEGDRPYYTRGMAVCAGAMVGVAGVAGVEGVVGVGE